MSASTSTTNLATGCMVCSSQADLNVCGKCKVVQYCGREHQASHWPMHKATCKKIGKARKELEQEQRESEHMTSIIGTGKMPIFAQSGTDLGVLCKLAQTSLQINTRLAVQSALTHLLEMTKSAKDQGLGIADMVPPCFLRLGKDQEAYDFMKWWITTPDSVMTPPSTPYTAVTGQNIFEPVSVFMGKCPSLAFMASLMLLKLRLFVDLKTLVRAKKQHGDKKLSTEVEDKLRKEMMGTGLSREVMEREEHGAEIKSLAADAGQLYGTVKLNEPDFWVRLAAAVDSWDVEFGEGRVRWRSRWLALIELGLRLRALSSVSNSCFRKGKLHSLAFVYYVRYGRFA